MNKQNAADFSQGSIGSRIMAQAIPLSLAEIVQLLYNIVDRIFLGHLPDGNTLALTGEAMKLPSSWRLVDSFALYVSNIDYFWPWSKWWEFHGGR